ncbi:FecR family protein [Tumidithrix elongata RA019]|uniref:FecR family protein n=1 Tax=Tumidithrix elongata BACA0141 TaxID=2716417 RepID=A0AAW9Q0H6_9CYAN|nr:FecR family protein [Tumidithrix elongata RA019]
MNGKLGSSLWGYGIASILCCFWGSEALAQQSLQVRTDQWLQVEQVRGAAVVRNRDGIHQAQFGDRLQDVGDEISTGNNSSVVLRVDTAIGFVQVAENTTLRIYSLQMASDNGRITQLQILRGRARLQVRKFTNFGSRLEIFTPTGVSGVRGTQFAVGVDPRGKTTVATLEGRVMTEAQRQGVLVGARQQNFTIPGEPPSPATVLNNNPQLYYEVIRNVKGSNRQVWLSGKIDPTHMVTVNGIPQSTDRLGRFSVPFPATSHIRAEVIVTTALGNRRVYEITLL